VLANQIYWNQNTNFDQGGCGVMKAASDLAYNTADVIDAFNVVGVNATCLADSGTIKVNPTADSDIKCSSANDILFLDGSSSGNSFTVSSGISKVTSVGLHTLNLTSQTSIPAGNGSCKSVLDKTQVNVTKDQIAMVNTKYTYSENTSDTGTIQVSPASGSDPKCNSAIDTLYLDQNTTGSNFTVSSGINKLTSIGEHSIKLTSQTSIPADNGTCKSTLDISKVTVNKGQVSAVKPLYVYTNAPPSVACKVLSSKVIAQSNWGSAGIVNTVEVQFSLQNFPKDPSGKTLLDINFNMKNNIMQPFWGNFSTSLSTYNLKAGKIKGEVWPNQQPAITGFINNTIPLQIGDSALVSMNINGVTCQ
jgi:hypothetical protein